MGAHPLAVAALVKAFVLHNSEPKQLAPLLASDATLVVDATIARHATGDDAATYMMWFTAKSVGTVTVRERDHVAFFQCTAEAVTVDQSGDCRTADNKPCPAVPLTFHVSGAAIDDHGWKLALVIVSRTISDRSLIEDTRNAPSEPVPAVMPTTGDKDLAAAGASWIAGKLAGGVATGAFASGTAPAELGTGAAAGKLAAKWDKLALAGDSLEATVVKPGLGLVYGLASWPYKPNQHIMLRFAAVTVREGDAWKWAVLDFGR